MPGGYGTTGDEWLRMAKEWGFQYKECATRHNGLVKAVKPADPPWWKKLLTFWDSE